MSEILIPIKEPPRCCGLCPCFHAEHPMYCQADKNVKVFAPYGKKGKGCPLIEVPLHGRLVDAGEVASIYIPEMRRHCKEKGYEFDNIRIAMAIAKAPTIIPASKGVST